MVDDRKWGDSANRDFAEIYRESDNDILVNVGRSRFVDANGQPIEQKSWRVGGDVWCVERAKEWDKKKMAHVLASPARLYAYLIMGPHDLAMLELDLRTRQLTSRLTGPLDRYLDKQQFDRLIELVKTKFPDINLSPGAKVLPFPKANSPDGAKRHPG